MRPLVVALAVLLPFSAHAEDVAARLDAQQTERLRPLDFAPFGQTLAAFQPSTEIEAFLMVAGIADILAAMAAGELTSETLTLWHLARIQCLDDGLRGMLELNPAALDEARAADARRSAGQSLRPLDGIPVSLKDKIGTAGPMHTTANAEILFDRVDGEDAALVASLRGGGRSSSARPACRNLPDPWPRATRRAAMALWVDRASTRWGLSRPMAPVPARRSASPHISPLSASGPRRRVRSSRLPGL